MFYGSFIILALFSIANTSFAYAYLSNCAHQWIETAYGAQPLNPIYEAKVRAIAQEMNITTPFTIRKMNAIALRTVGYFNAFAMFHLFGAILPLVDTPYLFISEGFFEDLSEQEQRFLVGHELVHIREQHNRFVPLVATGTLCGLLAAWARYSENGVQHLVEKIFSASHQKTGRIITHGTVAVLCATLCELIAVRYQRHNEWVADHESMERLHAHEGGIRLMERWMKDFKMAEYNVLGVLFADHPSCADRRAYCIECKNKHERLHEKTM